MRSFACYVFAALAVAAAGCAPQADPAAEVAAIRAARERIDRIVAARDTTTPGTFFAEHARLYPPTLPPVDGAAAIRSALAAWLVQANASLTFSIDTIIVARAGDMALETGTYRYGFDGPRGRIEDAGYTLALWQKIAGQWQISRYVIKRDETLVGRE